MEGYDFHRQKPVGNYILDFFCDKLMLAIEIDGVVETIRAWIIEHSSLHTPHTDS